MISPFDILHGSVLIVDDREVNVLLLERMLCGAGYASITLVMPGTDGFQILEGLKDIEADGYLPVLALTC